MSEIDAAKYAGDILRRLIKENYPSQLLNIRQTKLRQKPRQKIYSLYKLLFKKVNFKRKIYIK